MPRPLLLVAGLTACSAPEAPDLDLEPDAAGLVLVIHGGKDDPSVWADDTAAIVREQAPDWQVVALDWSDDADDNLTAARRGRRIGAELASPIADAGPLPLHLIAHSVGAHLAHGLLAELELQDAPRERIQLTLLDPFVGSGLTRWGYGRDRFGVGADFAEAYVNRDDGVPSTDGVLRQAHVFDVTALRPPELDTSEAGHRWPIAFYDTSLGSGVGLDLAVSVASDPAALEATWAAYPPDAVTEL
jgi:hypothetical protein